MVLPPLYLYCLPMNCISFDIPQDPHEPTGPVIPEAPFRRDIVWLDEPAVHQLDHGHHLAQVILRGQPDHCGQERLLGEQNQLFRRISLGGVDGGLR